MLDLGSLSAAEEGRVRLALATSVDAAGRPEEALEHCREAIVLLGAKRDRELGLTHAMVGMLLMAQDRLAEAREHLEVSLAIHRESGDQSSVGRTLL